MLNLHDLNIHAVADYFSSHPNGVGLFTYFIVFFEAMAVVGVIVPGAIVMPAIGFLIGSAIIPAGSTFLWAIAGAVTGDILSYFIGIYFQDRIHRMWPFTRWPNLLNYSEKFFDNHGGKSVFIGRFAGPTRAMIPMIAGMLKMPFSRFFMAALPSAIIWSVGYMVPGILLGALSLELPPKVAAEFTLWALLIAVALWLAVWLARHYFRQIWRMIDYYIMQIWKFCQEHKSLSWFTKSLSDPKEPDNHLQLMLVVAAISTFILFLLTLHQVLVPGALVDFSYSIYFLLKSVRSLVMDRIFLLFTLFGDLTLLLIASGVVFLWLWQKKLRHTAMHWLGLVVLSGAVISTMKLFICSPRPVDVLSNIHVSAFPGAHFAIGNVLHNISISSFYGAYASLLGILHNMNASSFPSAHCTLGVAFYGFLAVIITRELKKASRRYFVYIVTGVLLALIAFSRLFLGAHWFVDVLGGILLGLTILLLVTISYRRRHVFHFNPNKFILFVCVVFLTVWLGYIMVGFNKQIKEYALTWPQQVITFNQLTQEETTEIPLYRTNRLGRPIEAFNVMYVGDLEKITQVLSKQGWDSQPVSLSLHEMIKSFATTSVINHLSIFPQLYHNEKVALLFTKDTDRDDVVLILRLWASDIDLEGDDYPLWIGAVEYHHATPTSFSLRRFRNKTLFIGATEFLAKHLAKDFSLWKKHFTVDEQPQEMRELHWDGRQLIIKGPSSE
ncbi:MAG: phosphatase PAP2 family protein [Gammaproteobacteria bacterium]|nr:phosphatase PAP2 family protein [Gammaproteobacteria bacterium]